MNNQHKIANKQPSTHQICLTVCVVAQRLGAVVAVELPDEDEGEEDDDDEDDGDGDADQDGRVVRVGGDGLGPGRLTELVLSRVGSNLRKSEGKSITMNH